MSIRQEFTGIDNAAKRIVGTVYGTYQFCTALNSAFAVWGVVAGWKPPE
jgi:hypothetical protein